eukprot:scaffold7958_cov430-Prasinococcus_capsulatus_cf.AAC.4
MASQLNLFAKALHRPATGVLVGGSHVNPSLNPRSTRPSGARTGRSLRCGRKVLARPAAAFGGGSGSGGGRFRGSGGRGGGGRGAGEGPDLVLVVLLVVLASELFWLAGSEAQKDAQAEKAKKRQVAAAAAAKVPSLLVTRG